MVPQTSACFMESSVTQKGLEWGHRGEEPRAGTRLPSYTSGTEYVKLELPKMG